ncbi:MAG TPA: MurT ligase domain-containing protein [Acidimicrobiales bacterium]|nr:MurT ligase domain-containing protein [Acidimicrobiales bacterium]
MGDLHGVPGGFDRDSVLGGLGHGDQISAPGADPPVGSENLIGVTVPSVPTVAPTSKLSARTRLAAGLGGAVSEASRRLGRGGGSVIGGRAILAVDPGALAGLSRGHRIALVSGTNGKTTTTSLLRTALATTGPVVTNLLGANLPPGLAAALAGGRPGAPGALEVDEAWLGRVAAATDPVAVALLNLSRDQLDRNNEVRRLASTWRAAFERSGATVVANADDPLVVWGAGLAPSVRWVGAGLPWTDDAAGCPACGGRISFDPSGDWACGSCDFSRPKLDAWLEGHELVSSDGSRTALPLSLPGRANRANAAMAIVVAEILGVERSVAASAMASVSDVVGRYSTVRMGGTEARLLLAKNPAGWLEVFDVLRPAPMPVVVAINARIADGRDPSWLWDVPFERLTGRVVFASGERSRDLAVRLHYAEVEHVHEPDPIAAVTRAHVSSLDVVGNYTAFQDIRTRLS